MPRPSSRWSRGRGTAATLATTLVLAVVTVLPTASASTVVPAADAAAGSDAVAAPIPAAAPSAVSADTLPTVQIDGVVWSQAVVGTTVYAAGAYDNARPAGAAPGVDTVERKNLLSYDITTGVLDAGFAPQLNAAALVVAAAPDGRRVYVGGNFTSADGLTRQHIVAYDTATGQVVQSFAPSVDALVSSMYVTDTTLYVGGSFTVANGVARSRLAAFATSDGSLLGWAPAANSRVDAMVLTPDRSKLIVGGRFTVLNGVAQQGLQAVDPVTGTTVAGWAAATVVRNGGSDAGITSLTTDGTNVYGTGFVYFLGQGNLEGAFSADAATGRVNWIEDCHGDTYASYPLGGALYTVGHAHSCDNINGFPEQTVDRVWWRTQAFTTAATGTIHHNSVGSAAYFDWAGYPSPSPLSWYPALEHGTATGQGQAAWSVTGNAQYVVLGGEFPTVNSIKQQGLARFAVRSRAPLQVGPEANPLLRPSITTVTPNTLRVAWQTTWDRDDRTLTYKVFRNSDLTTPVYTVAADSTFWNRPWLSWTDTAVTPGSPTAYRVFAYDPSGNLTSGPSATAVAATADTATAYTDQVKADGAGILWRLDEPSGDTAFDSISGYDAVVGSGVTRGVAGPGPTATASSFTGTGTSTVTSQYTMYGPRTFSVSARFRTTSVTGGQLVGFGNQPSGLSTLDDRALYLTSDGRVYFDVFAGAHRSVSTRQSYSDGRWHVVTATMSATTMTLYVDGVAVATRSDGVYPWFQNGTWRIGGDRLAGMTNAPANNYFTGAIADVAVYPTALTAAQVRNQAAIAAGGAGTAPTASFTSVVTGRTAALDGGSSTDPDGAVVGWTWSYGDGATGTGRTSSHTYAADGTYLVTLTVTDDSGLAAVRTVPVVVDVPDVPPTAAFTSTATLLTVALDGSGSTDTDGSVVGYAWDFGDGTTQPVSSMSAASHTYAASGTYQVTLTVTDSDGVTASVTRPVTVLAADVPPTAAFTSTATNLAVAFDGSASSDPDGTVTAWSWAFGDGATGSGRTVGHTYAAAGSYPVTLTVTDDRGGSAASTATVTVTAPVTGIAADSFTREVTGGLGTADQGGAWTVLGQAANYAVTGGRATLTLTAAGATTQATLAGVRVRDVDLAVDVSTDTIAGGGGVYASVVARRLSGNDYRAKVRVLGNGSVTVSVTRVVGGAETVLTTQTVAGLTVTAGTPLRIRLSAVGNGTTTLAAKVWRTDAAEPAGWQTTATDTTAALQAAGGVGVVGYLSASATGTPVVLSWDDLTARPPAS